MPLYPSIPVPAHIAMPIPVTAHAITVLYFGPAVLGQGDKCHPCCNSRGSDEGLVPAYGHSRFSSGMDRVTPGPERGQLSPYPFQPLPLPSRTAGGEI